MRLVEPKRYFWRKRWPKGNWNPHKNIVLRGVKLTPKAKPRDFELETPSGSQDDVWVFRDGKLIYVLSLNRAVGYVGLAQYDLRWEPTTIRGFGTFERGTDEYPSIHTDNEVFTQSWEHIEEALGPRGLDLQPRTIVRRLMPYLPDF